MAGYGEGLDPRSVTDVEEIAGHGVEATVGGKRVLAGNKKLMALHNVSVPVTNEVGTVVCVAADNT